MEPLVQFDLTKEFLEAFKEAVERRDDLVIRESLESANHVETSQLLETLIARGDRGIGRRRRSNQPQSDQQR